jgi:diguanylate cyclase (GGDEF)-like protein
MTQSSVRSLGADPGGLRARISPAALITPATSLRAPVAWGTILSTIAVVGIADLLTGTEAWFGPIYLVVIIVATWMLGRRAGLLVGLTCAGVSIGANGLSFYPLGAIAPAWNLGMRFVAVLLIIALIGHVRRSYVAESRRARRDPLTGVFNKRGFFEIAAGSTDPDGLGILAYLDLDGLKKINDRHGHASGDEALCAFAGGVEAIVRSGDIFARIGGDEFLLFYRLRGEAEGPRVALELHKQINRIPVRSPFPVTCSMGAVLIRLDHLDDAIVRLADAMMYEAKQQGGGLRIASATELQNREPQPDDVARGTAIAA